MCNHGSAAEGQLKHNHDNMDVDTTSSPLCNHDDAITIEDPDDDNQRDSSAKDVDYGLLGKKSAMFTFGKLRHRTLLRNVW